MFCSNQQLKVLHAKAKVVELIKSDSRDAGFPFHVLCKEESRLVIALDHLTIIIIIIIIIIIVRGGFSMHRDTTIIYT